MSKISNPKVEEEYDQIVREQMHTLLERHRMGGVAHATLFALLKSVFFQQRIDAKLTEIRNDVRYLKDEHNRNKHTK